MSSKESMLAAIRKNKPLAVPLKEICEVPKSGDLYHDLFARQAEFIGARVIRINTLEAIESYVNENFIATDRIFSTIKGIPYSSAGIQASASGHQFSDIELAILPAHFAVAENAAVWISEEQMGQRIIPFICQHLALVVPASSIVKDMHAAYASMTDLDYGFGTFIAGPSKTADIEQSLIIGAHGARSLTIFIIS